MNEEPRKHTEEAPMQSDDAPADAEPTTLEDMEREFLDRPLSKRSLEDLVATENALQKMIERAEGFADKLEQLFQIKSGAKPDTASNISFVRAEENLFIDKAEKYRAELKIIKGLIKSKE